MLLPLLLTASSILVAPQQEGALRAQDWRILGPFRAARAPTTRLVQGPEEALAEMVVGTPWSALRSSYSRKTGGELRWRPMMTGAPDGGFDTRIESLAEWFPELGEPAFAERGASVFLYRTLQVDEPRMVHAHLGRDSGVVLWLNGAEVLRRNDATEFELRGEMVELPLLAGSNHLLVKLVSDGRDWSFALLDDARTSSAKNVADAIAMGAEYLIAHQRHDYTWGAGDYELLDSTALVTYVLLQSGLRPDHPSVARGLRLVREGVAYDPQGHGLQLLALAAADLEGDRRQMERIRDRLLKAQGEDGLWGLPDAAGDLARSHQAALGLRAALGAGLEVPSETWVRLAEGVLDCRGRNGSFGADASGRLRPGAPLTDRAAMSAAGVGTLALCRDLLDGKEHARLRDHCTVVVGEGLDYLTTCCPLHQAPGGAVSSYFAAYHLERAGSLAGQRSWGDHDWYAEGRELLIENQFQDGGWGSPLATSYALLFLSRATARGPVTYGGGDTPSEGLAHLPGSDPAHGALILRAALQPPTHLWIDQSSPAFDALKQVEFHVRPPGGEWRSLGKTVGPRYAARISFDRPGTWELRATAATEDNQLAESGLLTVERQPRAAITTVAAPAINHRDLELMRDTLTVGTGAGGFSQGGYRCPQTGQVLRSPTGANFRRPPLLTATSSATGSTANALFDLDLSTAWVCARDDRAPRATVQAFEQMEVARLRLAAATLATGAGATSVLPAKVLVSFDEGDEEYVVDFPDDPLFVLDLHFDQTIRCTKVFVEVLEVHGGTLGRAQVGFSELLIDS